MEGRRLELRVLANITLMEANNRDKEREAGQSCGRKVKERRKGME